MHLLKKHRRLFTHWFIITMLLLCINVSIAQPPMPSHSNSTTASNQINATVLLALTLTSTHDLHFGTMTVPTGAVNVMLSTTTLISASIPANISLLSVAPFPANGAYHVTGSAGYSYVISLPPDNLVTISGASPPMHIDGFVARAASAGIDGLTGTLDGSGSDNFVVGAMLKLVNAQPMGSYTGTFDVTVNYN